MRGTTARLRLRVLLILALGLCLVAADDKQIEGDPSGSGATAESATMPER